MKNILNDIKIASHSKIGALKYLAELDKIIHDAIHPDSDGGTAITPEEFDVIGDMYQSIVHKGQEGYAFCATRAQTLRFERGY